MCHKHNIASHARHGLPGFKRSPPRKMEQNGITMQLSDFSCRKPVGCCIANEEAHVWPASPACRRRCVCASQMILANITHIRTMSRHSLRCQIHLSASPLSDRLLCCSTGFLQWEDLSCTVWPPQERESLHVPPSFTFLGFPRKRLWPTLTRALRMLHRIASELSRCRQSWYKH